MGSKNNQKSKIPISSSIKQIGFSHDNKKSVQDAPYFSEEERYVPHYKCIYTCIFVCLLGFKASCQFFLNPICHINFYYILL